ncbi:MAG TPA: endonuclease III domain-containing protein [Planctomycetota bacterium]|nr:endonuclease III domain-containing protein [Planctomycetota bacterium]
MTATRKVLLDYYRDLRRRYGPQKWWPADSPFEVMVGAILTQNTGWANVEKAIAALKTFGLLDPDRMLEIDEETLGLAIRPAGTFRVKARRLRAFVRWFVDRGADVRKIRGLGLPRLREELLAIPGIGPETADSILLYAFDLPTFVADRYTWRVLTRHGLLSEDAQYDEMKELFERSLASDRRLFNEYHALIVKVGKEHCRAKARCERCPLEGRLPGR